MLEVTTPAGQVDVHFDDHAGALTIQSRRGVTLAGKLVKLDATAPLVGDFATVRLRHYTWQDFPNGNGGSGRASGPVEDAHVVDAAHDLVNRVRSLATHGHVGRHHRQLEIVIETTAAARVAQELEMADRSKFIRVHDLTVEDGRVTFTQHDTGEALDDIAAPTAEFLAPLGFGARIYARRVWVSHRFVLPTGHIELS